MLELVKMERFVIGVSAENEMGFGYGGSRWCSDTGEEDNAHWAEIGRALSVFLSFGC